MKDFKYKERSRFKEIFGFSAPMCQTSLVLGKFKINLFLLKKKIRNYSPDSCEYKGKPHYSVSMAIKEEYGEEAEQLVKSLI